MAKTILCLLLLASSWGAAQAAQTAANSTSRVLILENSTMPLPTAKATLIIGPLTRTNGIYAGDFKVKVFPSFVKSDWWVRTEDINATPPMIIESFLAVKS